MMMVLREGFVSQPLGLPSLVGSHHFLPNHPHEMRVCSLNIAHALYQVGRQPNLHELATLKGVEED